MLVVFKSQYIRPNDDIESDLNDYFQTYLLYYVLQTYIANAFFPYFYFP